MKINWLNASTTIIIGTLLYGIALSATYNFYFNNIEQGENGTASPSLSVTKDGEGMKVEGAENTMTSPDQNGTDATPGVSGSSTTAMFASRENTNRWRVIPTVSVVWSDYYSKGYPLYEAKEGWALSIGYQLSRRTYLNAFGTLNDGNLRWGAELEFDLIQIGNNPVPGFELALMAGVSTLKANFDNPFAVHAGGRLTFNFSDQFGVAVPVRVNLGGVMLGAGLVARI